MDVIGFSKKIQYQLNTNAEANANQVVSKENLIVVVDGGGSGCRLGAFDVDGNLLVTAKDGPASLSLGVDQTWLHIRRGISLLAEQLDEASNWMPSKICMGLAGSLQSDRRKQFLSLVPQELSPILVTDGHAQLLGATGGNPGACLAMGTGSVLHWIDESGACDMAGGWGFPVGDEGSGAWLGFKLVNAFLWHHDTCQAGAEVPMVINLLQDRIGRNVSDIQVWSTETRSTELARLAPLIVSAAEQGDALANSLLNEGAAQCERLIQVAPDSLPVYIVGGLADVYHPRLNSPTRQRVQTPRGDAFSGLYALCQSQQRSVI